jgi:hypothetical protein
MTERPRIAQREPRSLQPEQMGEPTVSTPATPYPVHAWILWEDGVEELVQGVRETGPRLDSCSRKSGFCVLTTRCRRHGTLGTGLTSLPQQQGALRPNLPQLMNAHSRDLCQLRSCLHVLAVPKETVLFTRLQHG